MSFRAKRELLVQVAPRYRAARHGERSAILDEFIAVTGYDRKYAIRVLVGPIQPPAPIRRPRRADYGREVQEALASAWLAANGICAKRLVPFLVELIPTLERHGHLSLTDEVHEVIDPQFGHGGSVASGHSATRMGSRPRSRGAC
jgi:hypothetical protein